MSRFHFLFLSILLVFATSSVSAQTFTQASSLLPLDSGKVELAPRIHAKGEKVYASWIEEKQSKNGDILFAYSSDGGKTFSTPVRVTSTGKVNASLQRSGEFAVDNKGNIHMVWTEARVNSQMDIFYSRSTDNGLTWSDVTDISRDESKATQDFPDIAADSLGNVYVGWIDNRDRVDGLTEYDQLYFCRSTDNGATWETPVRADRHAGGEGGSCECCRISVEASPEGTVFIAFRGNILHVRDIWVARSTNKGLTWDQTIKVQTKEWVIHSCPATGPMSTVDDAGNLHIVYRMVEGSKPYIFYNIVPKGASKAFTHVAVTPSAAVNYPDVYTTDHGVVYVAYQAGSDGIQYRRTTDGGKTWEDAKWVTQSNAREEFAVFAMIGDSLALVWQDNTRDKGELLIARTEDNTQGPLPAIVDLAREVNTDSVAITWSDALQGGMTWYEIGTDDGLMTVLDRSVKIPRELADRSSITVTPINSVGRGGSLTLEQLSVFSILEEATGVYPNPVRSGEVVTIPVAEATLNWSILDVSGKTVGQVSSHKNSGSGNSLLALPQLPEGIYYLTNDAHVIFKLIVRK